MIKEKFVDIIEMGKIAAARQKINKDVINGTTGVLKNDNNELYVYKTIDDIIRLIPSYRLYNYSPMDGGTLFGDSVMQWVFDEHLANIKETFLYNVLPTPGSAIALSSILKITANKNENVLISDIHWSNYDGILDVYETKKQTYKMLLNGALDIKSLKKAANEILKDNDQLILLINDPCHNPTGYSMSILEWNVLIDYLNSFKKYNKKIVLLYDIAYIDYAGDDFFSSRETLRLLTKLDSHVLITISFSGSKSFSMYGLRLGAQIILTKNESLFNEIKPMATYIARSMWSSPPSTGIQLMITLMQNDKYKKDFLVELAQARKVLSIRKTIFSDEAKKIGLYIYPIKDGFFITVPSLKPGQLREALLEKDIHVIPQFKSIRIAISNIPTCQITSLASEILAAKVNISDYKKA